MDAFEHQQRAQSRTSLLLFYYFLSIIITITSVYLIVLFTFLTTKGQRHGWMLWQPQIFAWVFVIIIGIVVGGSVTKMIQLSARGGKGLAARLGGREISARTADAAERKALDVVQGMAATSGVPCPAVFILDHEEGINAFVAGFSASDSVIGITGGCIRQLDQDELQGVVAHEFSHILYGDMRLNLKLLGLLNGILVIAIIGLKTLRDGTQNKFLFILGFLLVVVGYIGVFFGTLIKAAVSRQREFHADASAVQLTGSTGGIAGALKKIGHVERRSLLAAPGAHECSHMFFLKATSGWMAGLFSTHPPVEERIRRIGT
jgi:Zn-dependent protease with chaperone function